MSVLGPGCVKTRLSKRGAELFSQLPSSERGCQYNRLLHRRNRDGSSTRKLAIGFTQPGSNSEMLVASTCFPIYGRLPEANAHGSVLFNQSIISIRTKACCSLSTDHDLNLLKKLCPRRISPFTEAMLETTFSIVLFPTVNERILIC